MPICFISGPEGLSPNAKKDLMEETLKILVEAYQMPDDRVFISEYPLANVGHTAQEEGQLSSVQSEKARPVSRIEAPPGLPLDARRKMMTGLSLAIAKAFEISDLRDVLIFLQEYPIENVANNGMLQTENPEFSSPVAG